MNWLRMIAARVRGMIGRRRRDAEFDEELQAHLEMLVEQNTARGMTPAEARRAARIELGGTEQIREAVRDQRGLPLLESFAQDVRFGLRMLRKNPGSTAVALVTLALGIGATTAVFSVVYGVLLRPLPFAQPERIMAVWEINSQGNLTQLADPNFDDFRVQNRAFQAMAKYAGFGASISDGRQTTRTTVAPVSPEFMQVLRATPIIGRDFTAGDDRNGAAPTVIVSYGLWKDLLGSTSDLGRTYLKIENIQYAVIGVMPQAFQYPQNATVWIPADLQGENKSRTSHNYRAIARLRDGASVSLARQDISAIARRIRATSSEKNDYLLTDATVLPLQTSLTGAVQTPLLILLGAVMFLLLVACANVASLMLAQASARGRELAIRSALGAARIRLIRQFLTEALVLTAAGSICGVIGALWGVSGLTAMAPQSLLRNAKVSISLPVLAFTLALSVLVAVGLGTFTTMRATRGDLRRGLVEGARGQAGSHGRQRAGGLIVTAQIAITVVLVVGAGLLARSLMKVLAIDPGFRVDKILGMDISLPWSPDSSAKAGEGIFYSNLIAHLGEIPDVQEVSAITNLPGDGGLPDGMFVRMSSNDTPKNFDALAKFWNDKSRTGEADFGVAAPGYFEMMGIPLVRGRVFDGSDGPNTRHVAVISQKLARRVWPNEDPIGHIIEFGNMDGDLRPLTIVGVVKDVRDYGPDSQSRPTVYVDLLQRPRGAMTITMLSNGDTQSITAAARSIVEQMNPEIAPRFRTLKQVYSASLGAREFNAILMGLFGMAALLLAMVGVYGVISYGVSQRTREIGVRLALGAQRADVVRMVMREGAGLALVGIAAGICGAFWLTRVLQSLLFEVTVTDPVTYVTVATLLAVVALLACYVPARRAMRVDPIVALRHE